MSTWKIAMEIRHDNDINKNTADNKAHSNRQTDTFALHIAYDQLGTNLMCIADFPWVQFSINYLPIFPCSMCGVRFLFEGIF